ncbi:hypothetical protein TPHA_0C00480 [Tetrapisispora phaffii CBS 4417]|uniref:Deacetylase sirtuin-type domain-containing protein n=1 Tax=Tetrapisispora phaffii (strain ATCC 24235 / CBS 4417 / NBRC 1672 / NRRL Y-8282 / UCD 70-5) TaxID=1071381 RepID=G8BR29_TETPH|nr:hypothetical protein TPHA_0C00480 [Tetrapisispora phaffii CBS 4417]CCE62205.1 hypothetical protein TPHA_0C00480 [Tetrapisispora phaffii CBS 4417]
MMTTTSPEASRSSSFNFADKFSLQSERVVSIMELESSNETLQRINKALNRSRKIAVLTGAGISCNAGIPDFRSSTGLYDLVKSQYPELTIRTGQEMFDISLFRDEMKIQVFATFMEKLYTSTRLAKPTKTHRFIAHLRNRNKLLRCYTQNIDGLEELLGLEMSKKEMESKTNGFVNRWKNFDVVQLHGDLNSLACTRCFHTFEWNRFLARSFRRGELPSCPECLANNAKRTQEGKRNLGLAGFLRPNIVLYGENHQSSEFISQGINYDISKGRPDFLIIMGTSLKVDGVKRVVKTMSKQIHEKGGIVILVNKTILADSQWAGIIDYQIVSDCDSWVSYLEKDIPELFKTQEQFDKLRQLKREASQLRKQKKLQNESKKEDATLMLKTPPTTPQAKELQSIIIAKDETDNVKRKLLEEEIDVKVNLNKKIKV